MPATDEPPEAATASPCAAESATAPPTKSADGDPRRRRWWALGFVLVGNLAVFAAVTMMNVPLPEAQQALGLSDQGRQWVVTLYSLCFGAFMLLGGRIADVIGLRRCLLTGLIGFAVAATAMAMISVMFTHGAERARAFALFGMVMGMGTATSFTVAGALVDGVSWRWVMPSTSRSRRSSSSG